jgi:tRNA G18 (ribose-2'-O)-methylase SpoU
MLRLHPVTNLDLPELQPYRTMRQSQDHHDQGIFVAEGVKVVRRLLESRFEVVSVLLPDKWIAEFEPLISARPEKEIPVYVVTEKQALEELIGFSMYQGVLAVGRVPRRHTLAEVLHSSPRPRLFAAADGVSNAENLGALVRNCAAFGVHALISGETSSSPFLRRAVRNSMGTVFKLPVVDLANERPNRWRKPSATGGMTLVQALGELRQHGMRCIAAHPHAEGRTLMRADFTGDCCILFGAEGEGISPEALAACDEAVAIPMPPEVDSLNVGAAAAVFLYEANRQRGEVGE